MSSLKGENQAAAFVNQFYPEQRLGVFENRRNGFEFHSHQPVQQVELEKWVSGVERERIYYVDNIVYSKIVSRKIPVTVLKEFDDHTSENVLKFMSSKDQVLHKGYLIRFSKLF